ncbi:MAG: protease HtpX [Alphaproteobacteria bacterium]|nr:M48 family metalloprotease [Alphaproteobacteria bacterium]TAD87067.1 MAG: protease HtpX [Alphaproteobacteria bacterium]
MAHTRTFVLMAVLTALFASIGLVIGGQLGMVIALGMAGAMNLWSWYASDTMVLRLYRAQELSPEVAPDLYRLTAELAARAGLPTPRLYLIEEDQPNAFATGRSPEKGVVAVTRGLVERMSREELAGVIAHELAHIRNRDTLVMTITATLAGAIGLLANIAGSMRNQRGGPAVIASLVLTLLAPLLAMLVQLAISRGREYEADRVGAEICGDPRWLASALQRLHSEAAVRDNAVAEANPATAHLFIVNPLHAHARDSLFSTHPSLANRVAALMQMRPAAAPAATSKPSSAKPYRPWGR